jgi:hypothetical protein
MKSSSKVITFIIQLCGAIPPLPHSFMAWCIFKHRDEKREREEKKKRKERKKTRKCQQKSGRETLMGLETWTY